MKNPEQSPVGVLKAELQTSLFSPHNLLCHNEARCFVYGGGLEQFRQNDFGTRRTGRQARCLRYGISKAGRMPAVRYQQGRQDACGTARQAKGCPPHNNPFVVHA